MRHSRLPITWFHESGSGRRHATASPSLFRRSNHARIHQQEGRANRLPLGLLSRRGCMIQQTPSDLVRLQFPAGFTACVCSSYDHFMQDPKSADLVDPTADSTACLQAQNWQ